MSLFDTPIREKKVRNGLYAYQYPNGNIRIGAELYCMYNMTEAIAHYRKKFPAYKRK
jgi:hypothetical protein